MTLLFNQADGLIYHKKNVSRETPWCLPADKHHGRLVPLIAKTARVLALKMYVSVYFLHDRLVILNIRFEVGDGVLRYPSGGCLPLCVPFRNFL